MANSLNSITCLAFFSLVSNFCFGLNPNDWGPGSGWGSPSSMGSGPVGPGSPPVYGSGSPPSGSGWGSGSGSPPGFGYGPGSPGYGSGSSSTPGFGSGSGSPDYGSGSGVPPGYGSGPGSPGYGLGSGSPPGYGSGPGSPGYGSGSPPSGSGSPPGSGSRAEWSTDQATFYGPPTGDGNDVNACGYGDLPKPPYLSMVTAVNDVTFKNKMMGCGHCYQIKCSLDICSSKPITVTVNDWSDVHHKFDLSGTAFGSMAIRGQENQLRSKGILDVQYKQVDCNYTGTNVAFRVDKASSTYYFAMAVQYVNGDGLTGVDLKPAHTNDAWLPMKISWGGVYSVNLNGYSPPFSIRLTQNSKTVVAENVIPAGYKITTYTSNVNF